MKIVVFGGKGYLGEQFIARYPGAIAPSLDIADQAAVCELLDKEQPEMVINAAGKTGRPNVDWCEDHKEETLRANVTGPLILLEECMKRGIYLVHLSSGCIYTGDEKTLFTEDDPPNFGGSFYSRTKAWTDQIMKDFPVLVLRLRMPFDGTLNPRTLLGKLMKYDRVLDVRNSLTYLPDFFSAADQLIQKRKTGIFNMVNPGAISPYEVMEMYKKLVQPDHTFARLSEEDLSDVVKAGRSNCVLSTAKLEKEGIHLRPIQEVVHEAITGLSAAT